MKLSDFENQIEKNVRTYISHKRVTEPKISTAKDAVDINAPDTFVESTPIDISDYDENTVVIKLKNSISKLMCNNILIHRQLTNALTCVQPGYWFTTAHKKYGWDGKVRFYESQLHTFASGPMSDVMENIKDEVDNIIIVDERASLELPKAEYKTIILPSGKELRPYQVDAVNKILNNKMQDVSFIRGIINIATNGGKTIIAAAIINHIYAHIPPNRMFLFITHSKEIAYQTQRVFKEELGIDAGFVGDGKFDCRKLTIALVPTLYARYNKQKEEFKKFANKVIGFIGDELHHSTSASWTTVLTNLTHASIRIGLTGTINKEDDIQVYKLHSVTGDVLVKISNQYLIDNGFSAVPKCSLLTVNFPNLHSNTIMAQDGTMVDATYARIYQQGIVLNEYRNWVIAQVCKYEAKKNHKVLVLVEHIKQGEQIEQFLEELAPEATHLFLQGAINTQERQDGLANLRAGTLQILIATSILDEGVDVPSINAVIYARGGKSLRKVLQGIGRGLRKKEDGSILNVYDFIDYTSNYLTAHSLERYKTIKNENFEVKKTNLEELCGITEKEQYDFAMAHNTPFVSLLEDFESIE